MRVDGRREFKWEGIRHRKRRRLWRLGALGVLAVLVLGLGVFASGVVFASHNFSDVPTGAFYHNAVEWVLNRGITAGCAVGMYCPDAAVTRGQMAVFLRALGTALTPTYIDVPQTLAALNPDVQPKICQTSDFTVTGYPRTALMNGQVDLNPEGDMGIYMALVSSSDGGVSWSLINNFPRTGGATVNGNFFSVSSYARIDLNVGTTYRLGIHIDRLRGTADAGLTTCELHVAIVNRSGASSPLSPSR